MTFSRGTKQFVFWFNVLGALANFGLYAYEGDVVSLFIGLANVCCAGWAYTWEEEE